MAGHTNSLDGFSLIDSGYVLGAKELHFNIYRLDFDEKECSGGKVFWKLI